MDVWGFMQTPMLGRKSWQNYQGDVAREKPVKHQSCKSFPPAKSDLSRYVTPLHAAVFILRLRPRLHLKYLSKRLMCLDSDVPIVEF